MPFYDLICAACGHEFNKKASIRERTEGAILCPACGSNKLKPVFKSVNYIKPSREDFSPCASCRDGKCPMSQG